MVTTIYESFIPMIKLLFYTNYLWQYYSYADTIIMSTYNSND